MPDAISATHDGKNFWGQEHTVEPWLHQRRDSSSEFIVQTWHWFAVKSIGFMWSWMRFNTFEQLIWFYLILLCTSLIIFVQCKVHPWHGTIKLQVLSSRHRKSPGYGFGTSAKQAPKQGGLGACPRRHGLHETKDETKHGTLLSMSRV